jgi:G:T-mismatch repair DNA endonuclease (very short patch repair protein)
VTHWILGEIFFLQKLKRNIEQDKKIEERMVTLGISKKLMSHGF